MTRCSSSPDSLARLATRSDSRRIIAETIQCDSSNGEEMCRFFSSIRRRTAPVSRSATSGFTAGFSGPCTVTR